MDEHLFAQILTRARAFNSGAPRADKLIEFLRASGLSKVWSIKALVEMGLLSPDDAKTAVHESAAWSDVRADDDALHDALARGVRSIK